MVVVMSTRATGQEVEAVVHRMEAHGFRAFINPGVERKVIAALGEVDIDKVELVDVFANMPGVERAELISEPFKLSSRTYHPEQAVVRVGGAAFGFSRGESVRTEYSHKYDPEGFAALAARAGLDVQREWTDAKGWFGVEWLTPQAGESAP